MLWSSDAVKHARYHGLGMDALVIGAVENERYCGLGMDVWSSDAVEDKPAWFRHGCSGHQMQSNMNISMVWAWILWSADAVEHEHHFGFGMDALSSDAVKHERYFGLGMEALVIRCSRT